MNVTEDTHLCQYNIQKVNVFFLSNTTIYFLPLLTYSYMFLSIYEHHRTANTYSQGKLKYICIIFYCILKFWFGSPTLVVYRQKHLAEF